MFDCGVGPRMFRSGIHMKLNLDFVDNINLMPKPVEIIKGNIKVIKDDFFGYLTANHPKISPNPSISILTMYTSHHLGSRLR